MARVATVVAGVVALGVWVALCPACSSDGDPLVSMLPADHEVESWQRTDLFVARTDAALYSQIDGAGPKYIDRGWKATAYASYTQDTLNLQVAIHDMGEPANARSIYNLDLPVSRAAIDGYADAVVDMGLPTAYKSLAVVGQYYVEVSIDDHSDGALTSIERFTVRIVDRVRTHR